MKRQKRKYLMLIISSVILTFSIAILYRSIEQTFTYKETEATILSVETENREGGTSDDRYYYIESEIKCCYTVDGLEYRKTFTIKADYSGSEGRTITILYNKKHPFDSVLESKSIKAFLYSMVFTVGSVYCIFFDIRNWVRIRKKENENESQTYFPAEAMQQYERKRRRQKAVNIVLTIVSILLLLPLSLIELTLIVYTIARNIDYRMCYKCSSASQL